MARIGKVKFDAFGQNKDKNIKCELDLYYSGTSFHFYFEVEDIKKHFPKAEISRYDFNVCDTRDKAINLLTVMVDASIVPKRMLGLSISLGQRAMNDYFKKKSKQINDMPLMFSTRIEIDGRYGRDNSTTHQLGLALNRYLLYELSENKKDDMMVSVTDGWYPPTNRKDYMAKPDTEKTLLIEWTEERERYLVDVCSKLDNLGTNLLLFLANGMGDFGKFIDSNQLPALEQSFEQKNKE